MAAEVRYGLWRGWRTDIFVGIENRQKLQLILPLDLKLTAAFSADFFMRFKVPTGELMREVCMYEVGITDKIEAGIPGMKY
jgi:hypothetical protein